MIYAIHEDHFSDVEKKLNRVARKCAKLGNPFTFEVIGSEIRTRKVNGEEENHRFILVDVEGTAHVNGWEFIATLEIHSGGNVIRRYNTEVDLPERFRTSPNVCDHCNTSRTRKNLYVIRNTETNEFKQVGGNCLNLYTNGLSLEYVAAYMDGVIELDKFNGVFCSSGTIYYPVNEVIGYAAHIIGKTGYFNTQAALPTRSLTALMLNNGMKEGIEHVNDCLKNNRFDIRFNIEDFTRDNSDEVNAIIEYYKSLEDNSEFMHNAKIMLNEGYVSYKGLGYLCFLPQGYAKYKEREAAKAKRLLEKRIHWGEVGQRYKDITVDAVRKVAAFDTDYGVMRIYNVIIEGDTVLTWKTSCYLEEVEKGAQIAFTVKAHSEYKGQKQTEITRCKIA